MPKTLTFDDCERPVKANYGDVGYYRVHYDENNLKALGAAYRQLSAADRVSFIADAWAAVLAGLSAPSAYLELTRQLSNETELAVWESVIESLRFIDDKYSDPASRELFRAYARPMLRNVLNRLGWEPRPGEESEAALLRHRLIADLGALGDPRLRRRRAAGSPRCCVTGTRCLHRCANRSPRLWPLQPIGKSMKTCCAWRASRKASRSACSTMVHSPALAMRNWPT